MKADNPAAFPGVQVVPGIDGEHRPVLERIPAEGMTLRDWFAGQALTQFHFSRNTGPNRGVEIDSIAAASYELADAMLVARAHNTPTTPVDDLDLSARARNALQSTADYPDMRPRRDLPGIHTVGDLLRWSVSDLRRVKNLGSVTIFEVRRELERLGLRLRGDS